MGHRKCQLNVILYLVHLLTINYIKSFQKEIVKVWGQEGISIL